MTEVEDISARLLSDEHIVWVGRPRSGILFSPRDALLIPFSLAWCGFTIFWIVGAAHAGLGFALFGVPFVVAGLFLVFGRFFVDAWLRQRTAYALTNKRIMILRSGSFANFTTLSLDLLPQAQIRERPNGSGDLRFGPQQSLFGYNSRGFSAWLPTLDATPQFLAIPEARKVFDLVQHATVRGGG